MRYSKQFDQTWRRHNPSQWIKRHQHLPPVARLLDAQHTHFTRTGSFNIMRWQSFVECLRLLCDHGLMFPCSRAPPLWEIQTVETSFYGTWRRRRWITRSVSTSTTVCANVDLSIHCLRQFLWLVRFIRIRNNSPVNLAIDQFLFCHFDRPGVPGGSTVPTFYRVFSQTIQARDPAWQCSTHRPLRSLRRSCSSSGQLTHSPMSSGLCRL